MQARRCSHSSVGLERGPAKVEVAGSSPAGCTIKFLLRQAIASRKESYIESNECEMKMQSIEKICTYSSIG